uniref:Mitochondrial import receptor subunit TOM7 homolog n=1 Tax=Bos indicus x Bos taurus TaxID=30522 RepID=A0A4W2F3Y4_BOBOX
MVLFLLKQEKRIKKQIQQTENNCQFANHWGFIPLVISLVFKRCADPRRPEPTSFLEPSDLTWDASQARGRAPEVGEDWGPGVMDGVRVGHGE